MSTTNLAREGLLATRYNYRVDKALLLNRIQERLDALELSEREAGRRTGSVAIIQNIKKGSIPAADKLQGLAKVLGVPTAYLLGEIDVTDMSDSPLGDNVISTELSPVPLETDFVVGEVQAGHWVEALEWDREEWIPIAVPVDPEFERCKRFGLVNRGPSMNKHYPDGTVLVCVKFTDLRRGPENEDHVIVYRRRKDNLVEATCKEYVITKDGRRELWPRSTNDEYKAPLQLDDGAPQDDIESIEIYALVIGSYRPRPRRRRTMR